MRRHSTAFAVALTTFVVAAALVGTVAATDVSTEKLDPDRVCVEVTDIDPGSETVRIDNIPDTATASQFGVQWGTMIITLDRAPDSFSFEFETSLTAGGARALSGDIDAGEAFFYITIDTDFDLDAVERVEFFFELDPQLLDRAGITTDDIAYYRYVDDRWGAVRIQKMGQTSTIAMKATSPGFSTFALGTAGDDPSLAAAPDSLWVVVGEQKAVTVNVTYATNGTPVEGAAVSLSGAGVAETKSTGADGLATFQVTAAQSGSIAVDVTKPGSNDGRATLSALTPADLSVTGFTVWDSDVSVGANVTVNATVRNAGEATGDLPVRLRIDGSEVDSTTVTVGGNDTEHVEFVWTFTVPGDHNVAIAGLSNETISVTEPTDVVGTYDGNTDGTIDTDELRNAIGDWATGALDTDGLRTLIGEWATGG